MTRPIALLAALALAMSVTATSHAGVVVKAPVVKAGDPFVWPESPCNLDHRMDVAIVDGMFFECTCVRLHIGYQCDWMVIAGVTASKKIKSPKRITRITGGLLYTPRVRPVVA